MFSFSYDGWRDMSLVVTYLTDVMFHEERESADQMESWTALWNKLTGSYDHPKIKWK